MDESDSNHKDASLQDDSLTTLDKYFYNEFYSTDTSFHKSLDLDAFFGYGKKGSDGKSDDAHDDEDFRPNRIFLSRTDTFNFKYIVQFLKKRILGDISMGEDEAEGEGEGEEEAGEEEEEEDEEKTADKAPKDDAEKKEITSENKSKDKITKVSKDAEQIFENFIEYEYIDALYAKYDISKLTVFEYGELLNLKTHEERLLYLEKKFGILKKEYLVNEGTLTEKVPEKKKTQQKKQRLHYELVGTSKKGLKVSNRPLLDEIIHCDSDDPQYFITRLRKCGVFIFDITLDPNEIEKARSILNSVLDAFAQVEQQSPKEFAEMEKKIIFILISPLLTWAATKPIDPEEPSLPFTERDFKKRRAHPSYADHLQLEKDFFAAAIKYKGKIKSYVIAAGGVYGYEQHMLHYLFKLAWLDEKGLPVFGKGRNRVPLIHVDDLAMILHSVISNPPRSKYIFAIEKPLSSLKAITRAVSKVLATGKIVNVPKENAFMTPEISQEFYNLLTANLNVESNVLDEELNMKWRSEIGFIENIRSIEKEFRTCRNLKAIKILVVGPPGSGKTRVCTKLSEYYNINYLTLHKATDTYMHDLKQKIRDAKRRIADKLKAEEEDKAKVEEDNPEEEKVEEEAELEEDDDEEEEEEDDEQLIETLQEELKAVQQNLEDGDGKLSDEFVIKIMKNRLLSRTCQNQGYVLDGFPTTLDQTKAIFGLGEEGEDDDEEGGGGGEEEVEEENEEDEEKVRPNKKTIPDVVICLEANNDHLYRNLLKHPEVVKNNISEQEIFRNISKYRKMNTDENTLLIFFDQLELYPHVINVETDRTPDLDNVVKKIFDLIGTSCNYDTERMMENEAANKSQSAKRYHDMITKKRKEIKKLRKEAMRKKLEMWAAEVDRMKEEEEEILAKESMPLRHYLIKFVFPILTNGLIEVAKLKPDDPIDYLAEYLFKENYDGRMFVEDKEEPTEIKKMINMLYDYKQFLQESTSIDVPSMFGESEEPKKNSLQEKLKDAVRASKSSVASSKYEDATEPAEVPSTDELELPDVDT